MGQDVEGMGCGERIICFTLFICLAIAVLSTVSLFYLTAIVYVPVQRELEAGWVPEPVACTTIQSDLVDCAETEWISCYEWCISDPGGLCTQIWVSVRENGTDLQFSKCSMIYDFTCPTLEDPPANEKLDCKNIDNYQCANLTEIFQCNDGICGNISHVYHCTYESTGRVYDCRNRKNCIEIEGLVTCNGGICKQIEYPWSCERKCENLVLSSNERNVAIINGDRLVSARCQAGENMDTELTVWDTYYTGNQYSLFASCTTVQVDEREGIIRGYDCINGSALPRNLVPELTNYTELHDLYLTNGYKHKLDPTNQNIPFDNDIRLIPKTKLKINDQGCVNTLKEECKGWTAVHNRDGTNSTARARFPCHVMQNSTEFAVTRHSVPETQRFLMMMLAIPLGLWSASCFCVLLFSCCIKIDDMGHFRISSQVKVKEKPNSRPRTAWEEPEKEKQKRPIYKDPGEDDVLLDTKM